MLIEVEVKSNYGAPAIYPVNEAAKVATALTGKKTFTMHDLKLLRQLGHEVVEIVKPQLNLETQ